MLRPGTYSLAFGAALLLLAGCAVVDQPGQVAIAPDIVLVLPSPADLGRSVDAAQLITALYSGQVIAFETRISVTPARVLLVGTDGLGRRAMTVEWSAAGMRTEAADFVPGALRAGNVLADVMLMHWPAGIIRNRLLPAGTELEDTPGLRRVLAGGREMIRISHPPGEEGAGWTGHWRLDNLARGYVIDVQSAEIRP